MTKRLLCGVLGVVLGCSAMGVAQGGGGSNRAIGFNAGAPFSNGVVAGKTLYVAGQQGPALDGPSRGKVAGLPMEEQTANTIAAIQKVVETAGFKMTDLVNVTVYVTDLADVPKMNEVYKRLMPDPKPARATVKVAGLIGDAKIEISAIAVKQ